MKVLVTKDYLTNIANSIRNKKGGSDKYKPEEMSEAIDTITTTYAPRYVSFREYKGADLIPELQGLDTSNMTTMAQMFYYCNGLRSIDVSKFNTNNVDNMRYMFYSCSYLVNLNLSNFNTSRVTDASYMFANCERLMNLDIRNFNFSNIGTFTNMFTGIPSNCLIIVADDTAKRWVTTRFTQLTNVKTVAEL